MHIDEPKTPYVYDDGDYPRDEEEERAVESTQTWQDASYNHLAAKARHETPADAKSHRAEPEPPVASGRPTLVTAHAAAPDEEDHHRAEFEHMRKAVYADEGKKFKQMLAARGAAMDDDEADDDA